MKPTEIATRMRVPIPKPRGKAPKAAASWSQLKAGQWLNNTEEFLGLPEGALWRVESVDNQGADLRSVSGVCYRLTTRDWKRWFQRVRPPKTTRGS